MGNVKHLMQEDLMDKGPLSSRLEREMYEEMIKLRQQVTSIKIILEECK